MKKLPHDENEIIENMKFRGAGNMHDAMGVHHYGGSHQDPDASNFLIEAAKRFFRRGHGEYRDGKRLEDIARRRDSWNRR